MSSKAAPKIINQVHEDSIWREACRKERQAKEQWERTVEDKMTQAYREAGMEPLPVKYNTVEHVSYKYIPTPKGSWDPDLDLEEGLNKKYYRKACGFQPSI